MKEPGFLANLNIAADQVGRELVALIECDSFNLLQRQLIQQGGLNFFHTQTVAECSNVRNGSKPAARVGWRESRTPACDRNARVLLRADDEVDRGFRRDVAASKEQIRLGVHASPTVTGACTKDCVAARGAHPACTPDDDKTPRV